MFKRIFSTLIVLAILGLVSVLAAGGGADYGRGAETDPVASEMSMAVSGRVARVESQTNLWNGVTALQSKSNVWNGAVINGSNWIEHATAMEQAVTNAIVSADAKTHTIIINRGSVKSWVITQ